MRIGVLGSGLLGGKLGTLLARAGHEVVFSYARSVAKLERLARATKANARAGSVAEAVRDADLLLLAVHWSRIEDVIAQAGELSGKVLINCSLPMNQDDTALVLGCSSSGAERLAQILPRTRVVSALNTVPSEVLVGVYETRRRMRRPNMVYCGDDAAAKKLTAGLIRDLGFDPVDAGDLHIARYFEPFALLMAQLAYEGKGGPRLAYWISRAGARPSGTSPARSRRTR
ncbi:MAG TPA: NAD(P)-binding domain-containing protein [Steroidobacteraceae bacterium]|jgi:hypothetical protein